MELKRPLHTWLLLTAILLGSPAWSTPPPEAPMDLICVTEMPTTSFIVKQDNGEVDVQIFHHNGVNFAPFRNTLITPYDIPLLQTQASLITRLGDTWHFKWKRSSCNADSAMFFQCIGDAQDFESNGIKVHPSSLSVTEVEQKSIWGTFKHKNLSLTFNVGGEPQNYEITMNYQPGECIRSDDRLNKYKFGNKIRHLAGSSEKR